MQRTSRVLRVQLRDLSHEDWMDLLLLARESARFCNATMADYFARQLGYSPPNGESVFRRYAGRLSGDVRASLSREAFAQWKRYKKKIMRGEDRLACFQDRRALVCRAEYMSRGKRNRRAWVWFDGADHYLSARLVGKDGERVTAIKNGEIEWGRKGERHDLKLWWKPQIDERNRPIMDGLASGAIRLLKVSFVLERPGNKVFALLTYERFLEPAEPGSAEATLGPLEPDGSLWLRVRGGAPHNYTAWVHELVAKKEHFGGIKDRLRARTRRSGPGHRQAYRRALVKAGSFSAWASGRLHQMSADIVEKLKAANVGMVTIAPIVLGELPMHELVEKLKYKLDEAGIEMARLDPKDKTTEQAVERVMSKQDRKLKRAKESLRVVLKEMKEE